MRIGRHAPLLLGALFVLRVASCGDGKPGASGTGGTAGSSMGGLSGGRGGSGGSGGTTGTGGAAGNPAAASGTCVNGDVSYVVGGATQVHACEKHDCWVDVATGSASCLTPAPSSFGPFRTCRSFADCVGVTYCAPLGGPAQFQGGNPSCLDGVCDWATIDSQNCPSGYVCYPTGCTMGLWDGGMVTGSGGFNGTTSGGFPWDAATGN